MAKTFQSHPDAGRPEFRRGTKSWARYTRYCAEAGQESSLRSIRAPARAWTKAAKLWQAGVSSTKNVPGRDVRACLNNILRSEFEWADSKMGG